MLKAIIFDLDNTLIDFRKFKCYSDEPLKTCQEMAKRKGGKCLSKEYINATTKLIWQCEQGHKWKAKPTRINSGQWCMKCAGKSKSSLKEMQKAAKEHGGECLSKEYINNSTKLKWKCRKGHIWMTNPKDVNKGQWCKRCAGLQRKTIEEMQEIAVQRNGKCLSKKYTNTKTNLF